jgi:uncharacterized protein YjiS (DUF1127 family)
MTDSKNPSGQPNKFRGTRGPERSAMRQLAEAAGLSRDQMYQAIAVASVPESEFEGMVESDTPPTVIALARIGRGYSAEAKLTTFDRLRRAWNAASEEDRSRLLKDIGLSS